MPTTKKNPRRLMHIFGVLIVSAILFVLGWGKKNAADKEMLALCAKDGGVKIYEYVNLPSTDFSQWGEALFRYRTAKDPERILGPNYQYVTRSEDLKRGDTLAGDVHMFRSHAKVFRRNDNKLLGESVFYARSGGDSFIARMMSDHPSSATCPEGPDNLFSLFVKSK